MWFNHQTAIFAPGRQPNASRKSELAAKAMKTLDRHMLADLGMAKDSDNSVPTGFMSRMLHELRFTGYRGESRG